MGVSLNGGPPKSSILIGFSIIFTIHFGVPLFSETPTLSAIAGMTSTPLHLQVVDSEIFLTARDRQRNNGTLSSPRDNDIFNRPALRSLVSVMVLLHDLLICFSVPKSSCSTRVAVSDTDGFSLQRFLVGGAVVSPTGPEEFETPSKCQGVAIQLLGYTQNGSGATDRYKC